MDTKVLLKAEAEKNLKTYERQSQQGEPENTDMKCRLWEKKQVPAAQDKKSIQTLH